MLKESYFLALWRLALLARNSENLEDVSICSCDCVLLVSESILLHYLLEVSVKVRICF